MNKIIISDKIYEKTVNLFFIALMLGPAVSYSKLYLFHILFLALFFISILKFGKNFFIIKYKTSFPYLFLFLPLWYVITLAWSIQIHYSINYLFYIFTGSAISLFTIKYIDSTEKLMKVSKILGIVLLIELLICLFEIFTVFRLPFSPLSEYADLVGWKSSLNLFSVSELSSVLISPTGFHGNPNTLAIVLVLFAPFVFFFNMNNYLKWLLLLIIFVVVLMTGCRLGILAFLAILLINMYREGIWKFISGLIVLCSFLFLINNYENQLLENNYSSKLCEIISVPKATLNFIFGNKNVVQTTHFEKHLESGLARRILMLNGWESIVKSYGLGVGGGCSIAVQERNQSTQNMQIKSMHNFWFELLVDGGVILFVVFMSFYGFLLFNLFKIFRFSQNPRHKYFALSSTTALFFFLLTAMSASTVVYFFPMWLLFGLAIALINLSKNEKNSSVIAR